VGCIGVVGVQGTGSQFSVVQSVSGVETTGVVTLCETLGVCGTVGCSCDEAVLLLVLLPPKRLLKIPDKILLRSIDVVFCSYVGFVCVVVSV
jgi:hypothetical protein